jgi:tetratricopeptide (TPR) repeat protein
LAGRDILLASSGAIVQRAVLTFAFLAFLLTPGVWAVSCPVAPVAAPSEAKLAFLARDYDKALSLYQAQLGKPPNNPEAIAGTVETLLRQQKVADALDTAQKADAADPHSAVILTALAAAQYRAGVPWQAWDTTRSALAADPCYPLAHLWLAREARIRSLYATANSEARTAHMLDPHDLEIRSDWIWTLPAAERITELEAYLASPTGDDPDDIRHMQQLLDFMKKSAAEPRKPCRLVSKTASTQLPYAWLMSDAVHIQAFGLEVRLNGEKAKLQIDTGAGGILVSRSVAQRAGLKAVTQTEMSGIGSQGYKAGYTAYADSIRVGDLEFQDCAVRVLDSKTVADQDGLIGMDVFANFLVTLDYPMRKMGLDPLPPRPGEQPAPAALRSDQSSNGPVTDQEDPNPPSASSATDHQPRPHGPYDRYIAPEMKDWTSVFRIGHELMLPVSLNHKVTKLFILDTGSSTTCIAPAAAREVTKIHPTSYLVSVKGISGTVKDTYLADNLTFYFANLGQPAEQTLSFDLSSIGRSTGMEISGLIGANTIDLTTLKIDYRDGLIHFDYQANRGYLR